MKDKPATLVREQEALTDYLQALLNEVPDAEEPPVETIAEVKQATLVAETIPETAVETEPVLQAGAAVDTSDGGLPEWTKHPFEALLFKACGLTLAVPLVELNGILEWPESVTPMPGHAPWFIGLHKNLETTVKLIDVALLVVPAKHRQSYPSEASERVRRVVLIGDGKWGLACDEVAEVVTLGPETVRWRTSRTQRKWLAGTVTEHMCALLDAQEFAHMLGTDEAQMTS